MSDTSVICSAIRLADQAIRRAMKSPDSSEDEIDLTLRAARYVERALRREGDEFQITKFVLVDPSPTVEALKNSTAFHADAQNVLDALEVLKGICGCPN
jgi:hypothetical protein